MCCDPILLFPSPFPPLFFVFREHTPVILQFVALGDERNRIVYNRPYPVVHLNQHPSTRGGGAGTSLPQTSSTRSRITRNATSAALATALPRPATHNLANGGDDGTATAAGGGSASDNASGTTTILDVRARGSANDVKDNGGWNSSGVARRTAVPTTIAGVGTRAASVQWGEPVQESNLIPPQTTAHEMLEVGKEDIDMGIAMDIEDEVGFEGGREAIPSDMLRDDVAYALDANAGSGSFPSPKAAAAHVDEAQLVSAERASLRATAETSVIPEIVPGSIRPFPIAAPAATADEMSPTAGGIEVVGVGTEPVSAMQQPLASGGYRAGGCSGGSSSGGGGGGGSLKRGRKCMESEVELEAEEGSSESLEGSNDSPSEGSRDPDNKKPKRARSTTRASHESSDSSGGSGGGGGVTLRTSPPSWVYDAEPAWRG